jgi:hypothetical protein
MNTKRFYLNIAGFFAAGIFWTLLDVAFDKDTDFTNLLILAFFIVWNANACRKNEDV